MPCASSSMDRARQPWACPGHPRLAMWVKGKTGMAGTSPAMTERETLTMPNIPTLASLADDLESGRTSARKLVDECLARIADPSGEGVRTFIHLDAQAAIEAAEAVDRLLEVKAAPAP